MSTDKTEAEKRAERLASALRANLGRRKAQARGRDARDPRAPETPASGGEAPGDAELQQDREG